MNITYGRTKWVLGCGFRDTKKYIHNCGVFRFNNSIVNPVDRLYFVTFKNNYRPHNTSNTLYFTIDEEFHYENFFHDFGPLDICMLYYYCNRLNEFLADRSHAKKKIIHYTSTNEEKRLNAAYLIGSFAVIKLLIDFDYRTKHSVLIIIVISALWFADNLLEPCPRWRVPIIDCW